VFHHFSLIELERRWIFVFLLPVGCITDSLLHSVLHRSDQSLRAAGVKRDIDASFGSSVPLLSSIVPEASVTIL
jgi:hypothetical protein